MHNLVFSHSPIWPIDHIFKIIDLVSITEKIKIKLCFEFLYVIIAIGLITGFEI